MGDNIKQKAVNSVIWSAVEQFSTLGIQMLCTLVVARFLKPSDFGTVGMLSIFTAVSLCLINSGFKTALIHKKDSTDVDYSSVFYFNVFISIVLYVILFFCSKYIADFYNIPELESISKVTFLVLPISAFSLIQVTILTKNIDFKTQFRTSLIAAIVSGFIGICLALYYKNVWAVVFQNLSFYGIQCIMLWVLSKWKPLMLFSFESIKGMFSFSMNMMLSTLVATFFNNLYVLVIGKIYTPTDLGNFSQAQKLQNISSSSITEVVQRVSFPVLSKFQSDDAMLATVYKKIIRVTFFVVSFVMFLLMGSAKNLFGVLFDEKWVMAGGFFSILCLNGVLYPLHSINLNVLSVKGKGSQYLSLEIIRRVVLLIILLVSSFFDIETFVWGQVLYSIIVLFINLYTCGKQINYSVASQCKDLFPTFLLGLSMMIVLKIIDSHLIGNPFFRLIEQLILGTILYLSVAFVFNNYAFKELMIIIKNK